MFPCVPCGKTAFKYRQHLQKNTMNNKITASILFSFKGQTHTPSIELDLDRQMLAGGRLPDLYPLIARANGYDMYSYEYEMMQAEEIQFSQAEGLVADFITDGRLDIEAFENAWNRQHILNKLQTIASRHLGIDDLEKHPDMQTALLEAYKMGAR